MKITSGIIRSAQKVVIYGPEGIGKSTFASRFPHPLFIDTEGSTKKLDVQRFEKPSSWEMLMQQVKYVTANPSVCKTLVIDTIDWAEQLCLRAVCDKYGKKGIEDFGYGNGYVYEKEEFGKLLNALDEVIAAGVHVVLTAHAAMRKFEQPDEMGAYDRWELKLGKKTGSQISPLVKEWADMVLFANYKTMAVAVDDKGKKFKAQGGTRVMYTAHHPCWDAKNRDGLPEELPFSYDGIAAVIEDRRTPVAPPAVQNVPKPSVPAAAPKEIIEEIIDADGSLTETAAPPVPVNISSNIPRALADLMAENNVTEKDIQTAVAAKGYFPADTPIENYGSEFINGVLIGAWPQVLAMVKEINELPFDIK